MAVEDESHSFEEWGKALMDLRECITKNSGYTYLDENKNKIESIENSKFVKFGADTIYNIKQETNYFYGNTIGEKYNLISLLFFWENRDLAYFPYLIAAQSAKITAVGFTYKSDLVDFLTSKKDTSENVKTELESESSLTGNDKKGSDKILENQEFYKNIKKREREIISSNSIICGNKSFKHVIDIADNVLKRLSENKDDKIRSTQLSKIGSGSSEFNKLDNKTFKRTKKTKTAPIIVVPAAATSLVNMYNVLDLLKDQKFTDSRTVMNAGKEKPREHYFEHKPISNLIKTLKYRIVDSTQDFRQDDWKNIVCVFTAGATWQFTNWHWNSPKEVFENCLGFYPKYHDERPKDIVKGWNILPINIERHKRHTDRAMTIEIWNQVERFIATKKPWLLDTE
ncbi:hypothetical protein BB559_001372 [Furculomyces boomerangus]|uniref:Cell division control protein 73 C-terminal domain-containing protein n=2 Tax=Harpellales TaxID=61421 RepID=A0A2T9Z263_9FUNG|nr:hypothetical protein BB559_001372 [Furculomyces boomerangus]PVZ98555.1 hypothetical protein BB558_005436 [Smittium angustum]PWA02129.1 hypothetical protein BB558_001728 [Smittium angustum]